MSDVRITATNSISAIDTWLKALAGNLTGSTVTGFRQTRVQFEDVLTQHLSAGAPGTTGGGGDFGGINPIQLSVGGTAIKSTRTDFSQGSLNGTQRPTDLAISGDGFFVLSKKKEPTSMKDLVFTRNGSFTFNLESDPSILSANDRAKLGRDSEVGVMRLVSQDGLYVMGVTGSYEPDPNPGVPGTPKPFLDARANNGEAIGPVTSEPGASGDAGMGFKPFSYPFVKDSNGAFSVNEDLLNRTSFDTMGLLRNSGTQDVPDSTEEFERSGKLTLGAAAGITGQEKYNKYVSVMTFATPDGLYRTDGTNFTWNNTAGSAFVGVAGTDRGPVGASNSMNAMALETSNSSVNTTLPELTIAQKSFTANVKIISVGNTLIDDVNQLIR
ncbi:MAG TPA: flagellar hook-basal body complex protein [Pantanalinema sp.]